jgi:uncharacterized membrane protein YtjA (UPF0391 family)
MASSKAPVSDGGCQAAAGSGNPAHRLQQERHVQGNGQQFEEIIMLHYALVFFVIALVAALFGFGGLAAGAAGIAKVLFFIFLVLFVVSLLGGMRGRGR